MKKYAFTIIKYLFAFIVLILGCNTVNNFTYFAVSIFELLFIIFLSNSLKLINKYFQILNDVLMLLFNAQNLVLLFGNSYISYVMLENTSSINMLRGRIVIYSIGVIAVIILSCLRIKTVEVKHKWMHSFAPASLAVELILILSIGFPYTPACGYISLAGDFKDHAELKAQLATYSNELSDNSNNTSDENTKVEATEVEVEVATENEKTTAETSDATDATVSIQSAFKQNGSSSGFNLLGSDKNVILILTEGLSKGVVNDDRGLMPNISSLAGQSISFSNYFNHTFATYRGVQGQLYSGEQLENSSVNNFESIMDVMRSAGYYTAMINTEPANSEWTTYLNNLGFDTVITDTNYAMIYDGDAYNKLLETALSYQNAGQKFFLVIYTVGTHATFDSDDMVFGDGSDAELNKFYNCDYQFGKFFEQFKNSSLYSDTFFVLTADHATYTDQMFSEAFPNYQRTSVSCDQIPLYIYYQGFNMNVDAQGRNSLDMAPTLLDILGLQAPETFLGSSLFYAKESGDTMDNYYWDSGLSYYTGNEYVEVTPENLQDVVSETALRYCATSMQ